MSNGQTTQTAFSDPPVRGPGNSGAQPRCSAPPLSACCWQPPQWPETVKTATSAKRSITYCLYRSTGCIRVTWLGTSRPTLRTLAMLMAHGVDYSNASTPFPSDSFPGMVGQLTGGNPSSTGIYYDDSWNHAVFPAGTTNCTGPAPGGEVTYFEALDYNLALDAGQGIVPAAGSDPWANILQMTGNPLDVINPAQLPVDPITCKPIYPNQYLKVNTVFEVAHQH